MGHRCPGGYASGVLLGGYRLGEGMLWLNTLRILENMGTHPAAEQMLVNFIHYASKWTGRPPGGARPATHHPPHAGAGTGGWETPGSLSS